MAERGQKIEGITVQFREFVGTPRDEGPRAAMIAGHYGIQMTPRIVGREEFVGDVPAILNAMDQPSVDGVNTWFASKAVAERGYKVVLSGVGGDELFCGYDTFRTVPRTHRTVRGLASVAPLRQIGKLSFAVAAAALKQPKLAAVGTLGATWQGAYLAHRGLVMPHELAALIGPQLAAEGLAILARDPTPRLNKCQDASAVAALESTRYLQNQLLRDSDWASMAHSLELRTPFVDWALLNRLAPLVSAFGAGKGKRILASSPARPLPESIVTHSKTGFGLPIDRWLDAEGAAVPPGMSRTWGRRWAWRVAREFGVV
jgi:asparagine synthase (glutamine-hydrolysing)